MQKVEYILEILSEYGRLTISDIIDKTLSNYQSKEEYLNEYDEKRIKETFDKLVQGRYISRVEKINFGNISKKFNFKWIFLFLEITNPIKLKSATIDKKKIPKAPTQKTKKRKISEIEAEEEEDSIEDSETKKLKLDENLSEILWMINFDQFIRKFRHEEIIEHVNQKVNPTCAIIISKIIQLVSPYEKLKNDSLSSKKEEEEEIFLINFYRIC